MRWMNPCECRVECAAAALLSAQSDRVACADQPQWYDGAHPRDARTTRDEHERRRQMSYTHRAATEEATPSAPYWRSQPSCTDAATSRLEHALVVKNCRSQRRNLVLLLVSCADVVPAPRSLDSFFSLLRGCPCVYAFPSPPVFSSSFVRLRVAWVWGTHVTLGCRGVLAALPNCADRHACDSDERQLDGPHRSDWRG